MEFKSKYVAKKPNALGLVEYNKEEAQVWHVLYNRQRDVIQQRGSKEYLEGLNRLSLSKETPQLPMITKKLNPLTGWKVIDVPALISAEMFFKLLANRTFPIATFVRTMAELDYVTEPDLFHEVFGHLPMLTEPMYADFVHAYAKRVLTFPEKDWPLLQRFFWFTVEFGLIQESSDIRIYGGGILSSYQETVYATDSEEPQRREFSPVDILRTPYRIDQLQPIYYVINDYKELYDFANGPMEEALSQARKLGEFPPTFAVDDSPAIHIHAC